MITPFYIMKIGQNHGTDGMILSMFMLYAAKSKDPVKESIAEQAAIHYENAYDESALWEAVAGNAKEARSLIIKDILQLLSVWYEIDNPVTVKNN